MRKVAIDQIQCPSCGEYRMVKATNFGPGAILLSILTLGLYALISALWALKVGDKTVKPGDSLKCLNCSQRWKFEG